MGNLQTATVEKLQPFRDTQMAEERAFLEIGPGRGPICLQDNRKVIQSKCNKKLKTGTLFLC